MVADIIIFLIFISAFIVFVWWVMRARKEDRSPSWFPSILKGKEKKPKKSDPVQDYKYDLSPEIKEKLRQRHAEGRGKQDQAPGHQKDMPEQAKKPDVPPGQQKDKDHKPKK